jgi:hypothetical protein
MTKKRFRKERPPKMLRFFFWDGKLHRTLFIDRPHNILTAWCYEDAKKVQFVYSHIRVHRERAWRTSEVAELVSRSRSTVRRVVREKLIRPPVKTYSLDGEEHYPGITFWSAANIYELHDYLLSAKKLRHETPSRMELVARMEEGASYVIQRNDGEKVRAFRETIW